MVIRDTKMNYRVEIVINNIDKTTDTIIWKGTQIVEHKTIDEFISDTPSQTEKEILKAYHANKGDDR